MSTRGPMTFTRREFIKGGVSAFTLGFAAPAFLSDLALAQGASGRNLVVLYLSGGNDSLSTVVPYTDPFYFSRRPNTAIAADTVLQIGSDGSGKPLGLHPRLTGLRQIFEEGNLAVIQRTGYKNSSRSHFQGTVIWSTANPTNTLGSGWLGRYLDTLPQPADPLAGWCTIREVPHSLLGNVVSVPGISNPTDYAFKSPNTTATEQIYSRTAMEGLASHLPADQPHLAFVNGSARAAIATLDRVATVTSYTPTVPYATDGLSSALKTVAAALFRGIGTKVFWVQIGGFDTHAGQGTTTGTYANLMRTIDTALAAF